MSEASRRHARTTLFAESQQPPNLHSLLVKAICFDLLLRDQTLKCSFMKGKLGLVWLALKAVNPLRKALIAIEKKNKKQGMDLILLLILSSVSFTPDLKGLDSS